MYPRFNYSYKEIDEIYVTNYIDGEQVDVKVSEEDKEIIYSIIKHSRISVDLMAEDNCGADGPGISVIYNDGISDSWGSFENDHTGYINYLIIKYFHWKFQPLYIVFDYSI